MFQLLAVGSVTERILVGLACAVGITVATVDAAQAAERIIPPQTERFDCGSVKPGDTLIIPAGTRGPLKIFGCTGTQSNRIIIKNDPAGSGPVVIRRSSGSSGGFIFDCENCIGVEIDGSAKWNGAPSGKTYGIKVTMTGGSGPSAFVRIGGLSRFVTIRNIEVDGAWPALASNGSGIRINDLRVQRSKYPGLWREGILIENSHIHDIRTSGMYIGPNYGDGDIPLRNIEIRHNLVEDTGLDGIQTKSMWDGNNSIHHNVVRRAGKSGEYPKQTAQYSGIKNIAGTVKIYNNWVESTGQHGITSWTQDGPKLSENRGPFEAHIWNNVVVNAGELWRPFMQKSHGISIGAQDGCEKPVPFVYSNTIINSRQSAINLASNVENGFVRDNIVAGTQGNPVIVAPKFVELANNRVGSVSEMEFVDPARKNFRLKVGSPARNEATNGYPPTDHSDAPRPKEGAADQGAFEGSGS